MARIALLAIAGLGAIAMGTLTVDALARSEWRTAIVVPLFAALWLTVPLRQARLAVLVGPDGRLVVRNTARTRRFRRGEVADVRLPARGLSSLARLGALELVLTDGSALRMEATQRSPGRRSATEQRAAILAALDRAC